MAAVGRIHQAPNGSIRGCLLPGEVGALAFVLLLSRSFAPALAVAQTGHGVIAPARRPGILQFGSTPSYATFVDVWRAAEALSAVMRHIGA
ncbi:hypothetical protein ACIA8R_46225 [Nonomuraea sp. NPDC051191]|uniref:kynureninase/PvdN C-terminal domain-containing protein n=1 Tax=Nonomuraea sp. NPDC051191 TaxID=3364372 RepID=UPI0037A069C0